MLKLFDFLESENDFLSRTEGVDTTDVTGRSNQEVIAIFSK